MTKKKQQPDGPGTRGPHFNIEKSIARFRNLIASGTGKTGEAECLLVRLLGAGVPVERLRDAIPQLGLAVNSAKFQLDSLRQAGDGDSKRDAANATVSGMSTLLDRALVTVRELRRFRGVSGGDAHSLDTIMPIGAKLGSLEMLCAELRDTLFGVPLQRNGMPDLSKGGV